MEAEAIYIKHMDHENIVHSGSLVESGAWAAWRSISRQGCSPDIKDIAQSEQQTELFKEPRASNFNTGIH